MYIMYIIPNSRSVTPEGRLWMSVHHHIQNMNVMGYNVCLSLSIYKKGINTLFSPQGQTTLLLHQPSPTSI